MRARATCSRATVSPARRRGVVFARRVAPPDARFAATADRARSSASAGRRRGRARSRRRVLDGRAGARPRRVLRAQVRFALAPGASVPARCCSARRPRETEAARSSRAIGDAAPSRRRRRCGAFGETARHAARRDALACARSMANGWLGYQTLSCRHLGALRVLPVGRRLRLPRSAPGRRALVHHRPDVTRAQILLNAAHQFPEGDVFHWWHRRSTAARARASPTTPLASLYRGRYVAMTGDRAVLDEAARSSTARALEPGEDEAYLATIDDGQPATVYDALRARDRALDRRGAHGLPLMGTGDWNDGMNRVGREGRGESVWLAFFLFDVSASSSRSRGARRRRARRALARGAGEAVGGDRGCVGRRLVPPRVLRRRRAARRGGRRGVPDRRAAAGVGGLTGAVSRERAVLAMEAARRELVSPEDGIIRLLEAAVRQDAADPGLHQGLRARHPRERRPVHARRDVARARDGELGWREGARRSSSGSCRCMARARRSGRDVYQVEPYVVAADVYGAPPHVGRGGWTWYTGSAGWMLRVRSNRSSGSWSTAAPSCA